MVHSRETIVLLWHLLVQSGMVRRQIVTFADTNRSGSGLNDEFR